ncbi:unnamed protein product, partial [Larinioides sclopetarius]
MKNMAHPLTMNEGILSTPRVFEDFNSLIEVATSSCVMFSILIRSPMPTFM